VPRLYPPLLIRTVVCKVLEVFIISQSPKKTSGRLMKDMR
jgi:hypothetical protein